MHDFKMEQQCCALSYDNCVSKKVLYFRDVYTSNEAYKREILKCYIHAVVRLELRPLCLEKK